MGYYSEDAEKYVKRYLLTSKVNENYSLSDFDEDGGLISLKTDLRGVDSSVIMLIELGWDEEYGKDIVTVKGLLDEEIPENKLDTVNRVLSYANENWCEHGEFYTVELNDKQFVLFEDEWIGEIGIPELYGDEEDEDTPELTIIAPLASFEAIGRSILDILINNATAESAVKNNVFLSFGL